MQKKSQLFLPLCGTLKLNQIGLPYLSPAFIGGQFWCPICGHWLGLAELSPLTSQCWRIPTLNSNRNVCSQADLVLLSPTNDHPDNFVSTFGVRLLDKTKDQFWCILSSPAHFAHVTKTNNAKVQNSFPGQRFLATFGVRLLDKPKTSFGAFCLHLLTLHT